MKASWDDTAPAVQSRIIAYEQIRSYEEQQERMQEQLPKMKAKK